MGGSVALISKSFSKAVHLTRHSNLKDCKKHRTCHQFAKGPVESSSLLLSKVQQKFDVPNEIIPPLVYATGQDENDLYFTKEFATYDFESKLQRTTVVDISNRRLNYIRDMHENEQIINDFFLTSDMEDECREQMLDEEIVYDDEGNEITGE